MKKILWCMCICLFLCGCQSSFGSIEEGTLDMERFSERIEEQIEKNNWRMGLFNEEAWSKHKVEQEYHMDMTKIEDCLIKSSLIEAQFVEIAFFKSEKQYDSMIKDAIQYRLQKLSSTYANYVQDTTKKLSQYKQGRIGKYYYFILGEDCKKVVNYIRNSE